MTLRDLAERLPGGALVLREAPLRLALSAAFFVLIPALCLLFPALQESPELLAFIVVLAGGTSVLLLHLSRRPSGVSLRVNSLVDSLEIRRDTAPPLPLPIFRNEVVLEIGGFAPVILSPTPLDRLRFILADFEDRLPSQERDVVREIEESWVRCFEDHAKTVENVRAVSRRRPYVFSVREENLLIGSLFEETFRDLGYRVVDRIPWSKTMRMREGERVLQVSDELRWILDENYVLSATPVRRWVPARLSEGERWIPMRRLGESPQALVELVPPLAEPLSGEFADAFSRLISRVLVAAAHLKKLHKAEG